MPRNILYYIVAPHCLGLEAGYKEEAIKEGWKGRGRKRERERGSTCVLAQLIIMPN